MASYLRGASLFQRRVAPVECCLKPSPVLKDPTYAKLHCSLHRVTLVVPGRKTQQ
ncbi:hypothetical protein PGB90_001887 [Kerria lacca]